MFSGKSSDLFMLKTKNDKCYKPELMKNHIIKSRDFGVIDSEPFDYKFHYCNKVFFDEFQFFDPRIKDVIKEYLDRNVDVHVYGLLYDSEGKKFDLNILEFGLNMKKEGYKVYIKEYVTCCYKCGSIARHSKFFKEKKSQIKLGSLNYQPSCEKCL